MEKKFVIYQGVRMVEGWPEKIQEAQQIHTIAISGVEFDRLKLGEEALDWASKGPCHDCGVLKGQYHVPSCDVEECPSCGGQLITCDCEVDDDQDS